MADARSDKPRILSAATAVPPHRVEQGRSRSSPAGSSRGSSCLEDYPAGSGEHRAISALGLGFSAEHVLFRC
jgi:predicted naringenin-chalcone synthase